MRAVIQRTSYAQVSVNGEIIGEIQKGLLVLVGIGQDETEAECLWLAQKILQLRIFNDAEGKMNLSVADVQGELLVISQFTLFGDSRKGNRPSFSQAAPPTIAEPLYERFLATLKQLFPGKVASGIFGADMKVSLLNDGPVTLILDTKNK
jgi:D-tyrosyl-tRNA(Tyr) deacylase